VYAGTLEKYQGIDILIQSFGHVAKSKPDALLLIVGGTPEQVEFFNKMAGDLQITDSVIFTGRVPQKAAKYYTAMADVLVSPRSDGTNTPLKIYEQLASGIPLVATNIYSHTQVLDNQVAFLVDPEPEGLAEGILAALNSNGEAKQRVANARELYKVKYSREVYKNKLKKLLESLI
jgi:glycosyltransferase involved in cell wall biosynthesis